MFFPLDRINIYRDDMQNTDTTFLHVAPSIYSRSTLKFVQRTKYERSRIIRKGFRVVFVLSMEELSTGVAVYADKGHRCDRLDRKWPILSSGRVAR